MLKIYESLIFSGASTTHPSQTDRPFKFYKTGYDFILRVKIVEIHWANYCNRKEKKEIETSTYPSNHIHIDIIWMFFDALLCYVIMAFSNFHS